MNFFKKIVGMISKDDDEFIEEEELQKLKEITKSNQETPIIEKEDNDNSITSQTMDSFNAGIYIPNEDEFFGPEKTDDMFKTKVQEEKAKSAEEVEKVEVPNKVEKIDGAKVERDETEVRNEPVKNANFTAQVSPAQFGEKSELQKVNKDEFEDDFSFNFFGGAQQEKSESQKVPEPELGKKSDTVTEVRESAEPTKPETKENRDQLAHKNKTLDKNTEIKNTQTQDLDVKSEAERVKELENRSAFSLKEKVREDFKEEIMKKFTSGSSSNSLSTPISIDNPKPATTQKDEELIKERLYGDHILKKKEEFEEKNKQMFGNIDQKVTRVDLEKVNSFLELQRQNIYQFMEKKINDCYSSIEKENTKLQLSIKEIEENRLNNSLEGMRNKTKVLTELTLIVNKFITPKTRGLKRVKQYYQAIQLSCKEYESFLERYNTSDYNNEIEKVSNSIQSIQNHSQGLNEVFSLKKIDDLDNIQQDIENIHAKIQLKNKIVKEIDRRKGALEKFNNYRSNMSKQNDKLVQSDGFKRFTDMRANQDSLQKEILKITDKIVTGFHLLQDEIFHEMNRSILSPILKLYIKNSSETLKNDLNKELLQHLKRHVELNPEQDHVKVKSLMSLLNQYYQKMEEFKETSNQINTNSIMQDQLDLDYKQSHIIEKEYKIKQELQKLEIAFNKLNINFEKARLSKEISDKFNVNFLIN